jgi:hypothetical protein
MKVHEIREIFGGSLVASAHLWESCPKGWLLAVVKEKSKLEKLFLNTSRTEEIYGCASGPLYS